MEQAKFANRALVDQILGVPLMPVVPEAFPQNPEIIEPERPLLGEKIREGIYRRALGQLAAVRNHDRQYEDGVVNEHWRPSLDDGLELREKLESDRRTLALLNNIDDYVRREKHTESLDDDQIGLFEEVINCLNEASTIDEAQTGLEAATGWGKTHVMMELARAAHNKEYAAKQKNPISIRTLAVVHNKDAVRQISGQNGHDGFMVHAPELEVGVYYSAEKDPDKEVVVTTYPSFVSGIENGTFKREDFDLLLLDEVDTSLSFKRYPAAMKFKEGKLGYGFTATGTYSERKHIGMLFNKIVKGPDLRESIDRGKATPVQMYFVRSNERLVVPNAMRNLPDLPDELQQSLIKRAGRNQIAAGWAKMLTEQEGVSGLIECIRGNKCQHAYELAEELSDITINDPDTGEERKLRVAGIDGENPNRQDLLEAIQEGELDWLTGVDVFSRSINLPRIAGYIGLRGTYSRVRSTQMRGRVPRLDRSDPGKVAHFVEIYDDVVFEDGQRFGTPYTIAHILGLEEFTQGYSYPPVGTERAKSTPRFLPLPEIPEHLRNMLATSDPSELYETRFVGARQEILPAPEGWVSVNDLRELGLSQSYLANRMKEWDIRPIRHRNPDGTVAMYMPPDAAEDLLDFMNTAKEDRHNEFKHLPPKTWKLIEGFEQASQTNFTLTLQAQEILIAQGVPSHIVKPRIFRSRHKEVNDRKSWAYYSPSQYRQLSAIVKSIPTMSKSGYANELGNSYGHNYSLDRPLDAIYNGTDAPKVKRDRWHKEPFEEAAEWYAGVTGKRLPTMADRLDEMHAEIDSFTQELLESMGIAGRLMAVKGTDQTGAVMHKVGTYISPEERKKLYAVARERLPEITEDHVRVIDLLYAYPTRLNAITLRDSAYRRRELGIPENDVRFYEACMKIAPEVHLRRGTYDSRYDLDSEPKMGAFITKEQARAVIESAGLDEHVQQSMLAAIDKKNYVSSFGWY